MKEHRMHRILEISNKDIYFKKGHEILFNGLKVAIVIFPVLSTDFLASPVAGEG